MRRVALTGIGLLSPLGNSPTEFFSAALNGKNCVGPIRKFDPSGFEVRFGAEILFDDPHTKALAEIESEMPTVARWCVYASRMAVSDAGLNSADLHARRVSVALGISGGATEYLSSQLLTPGATLSGLRPATPVLLSPAASAVHVSRDLGVHGEIMNITNACSSSTSAIAFAARMIRDGEADCVVTGGAEESVCPMYLGSFGNSKSLSKRNADPAHASRPFDRERDGYVLSDAACILLLEDMEVAQRRGARIYCEIAGVGGASDASSAYEVAQTDEHGSAAVRAALFQARCNLDEMDVYHALGVSVQCMDARETRMLKSIFGDHARKIWTTSIKSMMGHPLGAAGAIQAAAAALSIQARAVPPTINYEVPDPECDLDYVPNCARDRAVRHALVYTLGNTANVALVLKSV